MPTGLDRRADGLCLATSVNQPDPQGKVMVRCLNPANQPLQMKAGTVVGVYTSIAEGDISQAEPLDGCPEQHEASLPPHLADLYSQAKENCVNLT